MKIKIYTTGGTIDKVYFDNLSDYEVGEPQVVEILKEANAALEYEVEEIARKDSLDLTEEDRQRLRQRIEADLHRLILITHGTDTMVQTARHLLHITDKVIVFTGALTPARFRNSDAAFNIGCAIGALQSLPPGVYIAMSGRVFPADKVRKNRKAGCFEEICKN
ncbi:MAG: asparaginase domain-containing protein [Syntrophobacteraceae bacterium]